MPSRQLVIFDFDGTVCGASTMHQLLKFVPDYRKPTPDYDLAKLGNVKYANGIFKQLHAMGYTPETLCDFICTIPPIPGMVKFIEHLGCATARAKYDLIMISDGYRYFVVNWLRKNNLLHHFTGIYCNPSEFGAHGELVVSAYHCAECPHSPRNLCKRRVVEEFLELQGALGICYDRVIYVGNGHNDFCPVLSMDACDLMCARKADELAKRIKQAEKESILKPEIFFWRNGYELLAKVKQMEN